MSLSWITRSMESGSATGKSAAGRRSTSRPVTACSRAALRSASSSAAPIAPMLVWYSGMKSRSPSREKASRSERTAPALAATPPMNATGAWMILPLAMVPLKLRITASHRPRSTSGGW